MCGFWGKDKMVFYVECINPRIYWIFEFNMEETHSCAWCSGRARCIGQMYWMIKSRGKPTLHLSRIFYSYKIVDLQ